MLFSKKVSLDFVESFHADDLNTQICSQDDIKMEFQHVYIATNILFLCKLIPSQKPLLKFTKLMCDFKTIM